jgi:hypothetical protein
MIGQYLPNNNEKRYSVILPIFSDLNRPLVPNRPTACRVEMIEALGRRQSTALTRQVATVYRGRV